ncbi:cytochrome P450 monooxygenase-like protein [Corynespora cassiicola Philippines]|uniref:Cytochrome P450 monooxygenase-like protein n=1 Tax=Corynespora cassiicola Philippines TaxID=1448308 RepID=A0A2T2NSP2_CORCC|nr:cytochrome P450 monooxygenase-like protein [Corynespora cassiicola Philippines]
MFGTTNLPNVLPHGFDRHSILLLLFGTGAVYIFARVIYNLFFHPLAKYPGPNIARITNMWLVRTYMSGQMHNIMEEQHQRYGDVVRVGPNQLVFFTAESFKDIHSHAVKGHKPFVKSNFYEIAGEIPGIVTARDPLDHRMQRKSLATAFSARSLKAQEAIVQQYVNHFIKQIGKLGGPSTQGLCMSEAFNWLTFDVISDLTFGEPLHAVAEGKTQPWIAAILSSAYFSSLIGLKNQLPQLNILLPFILPKDISKNAELHWSLVREKTQKRVDYGTNLNRSDFFDHIIKTGEYTRGKMEAQSNVLLSAGSETTATFFTAATYFLLKHPKCLGQLQEEIRSAFTNMEEITSESTARLPYLSAVVEETLRLYPPAAFMLPRISPGAFVDGHFVPKGTTVIADMWSISRDPRYWTDGKSFRPERWIGPSFQDNKAAFNPFSNGPRACIGINLAYMEGRITLAKLLWTYDWENMSPEADLIRDSKMYFFWEKPNVVVRYHPRTT